MEPEIQHKVGSTFELDCTLQFDGAPVDISGWDIKSDVRERSGALVSSLTVDVTDAANGQFTLTADAGTDDWSPGVYSADIRYEFNGKEMYSETFRIRVKSAITEDA